ncbi:hypothetical protein U0070_007805 [Myodes glareolus]|uniref:Uncharacterized protein n=1 Tax=Myodes glareolus TaxID=447135 RepID=A0AAW0IL63_MYOGA
MASHRFQFLETARPSSEKRRFCFRQAAVLQPATTRCPHRPSLLCLHILLKIFSLVMGKSPGWLLRKELSTHQWRGDMFLCPGIDEKLWL